ncbi:hypothetical protein FJT64_024332 [Amphibalanus amphitrite]|uniref:Uncharacterized protein n=1 Tax=Amphibalanus amphitrite TaxID=1232801 RepID=A0A6A4WIV4_AMPAM|nr:hypothetical protein FJT64_024332 [Amphibalanus amphitrite]
MAKPWYVTCDGDVTCEFRGTPDAVTSWTIRGTGPSSDGRDAVTSWTIRGTGPSSDGRGVDSAGTGEVGDVTCAAGVNTAWTPAASCADERPLEMSTSDGQRERDIQPSTEEETEEESVSDGDVDDSDGDREGGGDCRRLPVRTAVLTEPCLDGLLELARVRCHCGQTCPPTVQRVRMAFNVEWTCSTCGPRWAWTSVSTDLTAHRQVGAARTTR